MSRPFVVAIVDDDAMVLEAIAGLLKAYRYEVLTFASAEEILDFGQLASIDFIITDIQLGGKSGLQLQKELVEAGHAIPTIIITAFADNGYRKQALDAGAVDLLPKPISSERLMGALEAGLKGRRPRNL